MLQTPVARFEECALSREDAAPGMVPLAVGACFAAYHWAPGPAVLILPGLGREAAGQARVWRDLSLRLAERGVASLRPDLPGTGDSAEGPDGRDRVASWREAVRGCADWLAARHGGRVALMGCRFGALLAIDAVAAGLAADRLVLLEPPSSGRAFAREIRLRADVGGGGDPAGADGSLDIGDLVLDASALAAMADMPRPVPSGRRLPDALVFSHRGLDLDRGWPAKFRAAGARVAVEAFEGHEEFLLRSAVDMRPPVAVLARVEDFLAAAPSAPPEPAAPPPAAGLALPGCREEPRWFGDAPRRFGILCLPDRPRRSAPIVVLPSAANQPRSGIDRVWTDLARLLAREGIASFRFDQSGVGESDGPTACDGLCDAYRPEHIEGVLAAVEAADGWGFGRSVVVGLCSGAYTAWHAAKEDARVAGVLVANAQHLRRVSTFTRAALLSTTLGQYRAAPGGFAGAAVQRLGRLWRGELRVPEFARVLAAIVRRDAAGAARRLGERVGIADPDARSTRRHLASLAGRGCAVHFVYADADGGLDAFRQAFGRPSRLPAGVRLTVLNGADHTFSQRRHRERLVEVAAGFVRAAAV